MKNEEIKQSKEEKTIDSATIFGFETKTWAKIILFSILGISVVFLALPYILSVVLPAIYPDRAEQFSYISERLNGVSLIVGGVGTIASLLSIIMTFLDRKRYSQEKKESKILMSGVNDLKGEVSVVINYVKKTFEQNQRLALCLYEKKVIDKNPNAADVGVSTQYSSSNVQEWQKKANSNEDREDV